MPEVQACLEDVTTEASFSSTAADAAKGRETSDVDPSAARPTAAEALQDAEHRSGVPGEAASPESHVTVAEGEKAAGTPRLGSSAIECLSRRASSILTFWARCQFSSVACQRKKSNKWQTT